MHKVTDSSQFVVLPNLPPIDHPRSRSRSLSLSDNYWEAIRQPPSLPTPPFKDFRICLGSMRQQL